MPRAVSERLARIVAALPLEPGMRVLEIGCGPGVAARAVAERIGEEGFVLGIDRSATAIAQARAGSGVEMERGVLDFRCCAIEAFALDKGEKPFDLAFAVRVGALDGRHPEIGRLALARLCEVMTEEGMLYIDGGDPIRPVALPR